MEFFAGEAQATEQMKYYGGRTTARLDILYMSDTNGVPGTNPMDITTPCGMANLGLGKHIFIYFLYIGLVDIGGYHPKSAPRLKETPYNSVITIDYTYTLQTLYKDSSSDSTSW